MGGAFPPVPGQPRGDSIISLAALPPSLRLAAAAAAAAAGIVPLYYYQVATRKGSDLDIVNCLIPLKTPLSLM